MSGAEKLHPLDYKILGFVERFLREQQMCPTLEEIGRHIGRSFSFVRLRVQALKKLEYLRQDTQQGRSIRPGPRLRR